MAGHLHEECVKPRKSRRRRGTAWHCECGRVYVLVGEAKYPHTQPNGERNWRWKQVKQNFAEVDHQHVSLGDVWRSRELEERVAALEAKKKRVQKGA